MVGENDKGHQAGIAFDGFFRIYWIEHGRFDCPENRTVRMGRKKVKRRGNLHGDGTKHLSDLRRYLHQALHRILHIEC